MARRSLRSTTLLLLAGALGACSDGPTAPAADPPGPEAPRLAGTPYHDPVVGVSLVVPAEWRVHRDPVLFNTHGIVLFDSRSARVGSHERSPVARIALAYQSRPEQIEGLVRGLMEKNREFPVARQEVPVGDGLRGTAVTGLPGTDPYSLVYVPVGDRVYRIGLWTETEGLDAAARMLLGSLRFEEPTRSVHSLELEPVEQAQRTLPPPEQMALNRQAQAARAAQVREATGGAPVPSFSQAATAQASAACEFGAPTGLYWQTTWDYSNTFYTNYTTSYSGTYYNLRPGDKGWSAMSGNYGSWWGQGYHVRKCSSLYLNQYYANDWPVHRGGNVYSALEGKVEWAGWDYYDSEGYYTLGNYVVVRNGYYRAIMAHLNSIPSWVTWGANVVWSDVIGYAGKTGGPWDEHVHSRVSYNESLTRMGQPYGGNTVWPTRLYCYDCRKTDGGDANGNGDGQYDGVTSSGWKFYNRFYHGRWMRG